MKDDRKWLPTGGLCVLFAVVTLHPVPASSAEFAERIPGHAVRLDPSCRRCLKARRTPRDSTEGPISILHGTDRENVRIGRKTTWGLPRFSCSENGTVPFRNREVVPRPILSDPTEAVNSLRDREKKGHEVAEASFQYVPAVSTRSCECADRRRRRSRRSWASACSFFVLVTAATGTWGSAATGAEPLKAGMIGLDTSHVIAYTKMLNDHE